MISSPSLHIAPFYHVPHCIIAPSLHIVFHNDILPHQLSVFSFSLASHTSTSPRPSLHHCSHLLYCLHNDILPLIHCPYILSLTRCLYFVSPSLHVSSRHHTPHSITEPILYTAFIMICSLSSAVRLNIPSPPVFT